VIGRGTTRNDEERRCFDEERRKTIRNDKC
jgi:hypothetical protein